jgi:hypothetical protein
MNKLPASTGWLWVKQGFVLFRQQPAALSTLLLGSMLISLLASVVPLLGQFMPVILVPVFSVAFMQACLDIEQGKRIVPARLLTGFRKPAVGTLLKLGVLYLGAAALALGASALADGGVLFQLITGQIEANSDTAKLLKDANLGGAMLLACAVYIPAAMAFCFAAPLIYWQKMGLGKAIFFSFFAVLRALKAFIVFALGWFAISATVSEVVLLVMGRSQAALLVLLPLSVILTVLLHCSFYASYRQIFGLPAAPQEPAQAAQ